jgi:uncharacterized protein YjbI with pentapeptide repeats
MTSPPLRRAQETLEELRASPVAQLDSPDALKGAQLAGADLAGMNLNGVDLSDADLSGANLTGARLFRATLHRTRLSGAVLDDAELSGADLTEARLDEVSATNAGLGMATLRGATLFNARLNNATLTGADLEGADLRCAHLDQARLREARLRGADLTECHLCSTDLSKADVRGAVFTNADLRNARVRALRDFKRATWVGVDIRDINFAGGYQLRRQIIDDNYLKEFRESTRWSGVVYWVWWVTSDCGRSLFRWCLWIGGLALLFAGLYDLAGLDYGQHTRSPLTHVYYSVVTLTTLGYGDITPRTASGQLLVMLEVFLGYMMLGGLLSVFSNKIARRGE